MGDATYRPRYPTLAHRGEASMLYEGFLDKGHISTVGEHARQALATFSILQKMPDVPCGEPSGAAKAAATEFLTSCLALMRKFPSQAGRAFGGVLPFTELELELLIRECPDDKPIIDAITVRLLEWAGRSPLFVDEANVHAADFLAALTPHLDRWSERQEATAAAARSFGGL